MEPGNLILSKSYRVSYALFRVAGTLPERSFRTHLEDKALDLIVAALEEKQFLLRRTLHTIEYLIRFMRDTGHAHVHTADLILKEVRELQGAIAGLPDNATAMSVEELFPTRQDPMTDVESGIPRRARNDMAPDDMKVVTANYGPALAMKQLAVKGTGEILSVDKLTINRPARNDRQNQILEKIRQSGNLPDGCRLKDIQETLQHVSERTLRYDLQRLIEEGAVTRQGSGGPATYYRLRV